MTHCDREGQPLFGRRRALEVEVELRLGAVAAWRGMLNAQRSASVINKGLRSPYCQCRPRTSINLSEVVLTNCGGRPMSTKG